MSESAAVSQDTRFFGHPRGLAVLFFTEMWERFGYYGMRALLILYLTAAIADGGMGISDATAGAIYGLYVAGVYLAALPGGWIADRILGKQDAVFWGGIIIAAGHFSMALGSTALFFAGLFWLLLALPVALAWYLIKRNKQSAHLRMSSLTGFGPRGLLDRLYPLPFALRLLALATKHTETVDVTPYDGLTLIGLVCLLDPVRNDVPDAIATALFVAGQAFVGKAHVLKLDPALDRGQGCRPGRFGNLNRDVEDFEHTLKTDHAPGELDLGVGQGHERVVQLGQVGAKGDDGADGKRAGQHQVTTAPKDDRRAHGAYRAQQHNEPL